MDEVREGKMCTVEVFKRYYHLMDGQHQRQLTWVGPCIIIPAEVRFGSPPKPVTANERRRTKAGEWRSHMPAESSAGKCHVYGSQAISM